MNVRQCLLFGAAAASAAAVGFGSGSARADSIYLFSDPYVQNAVGNGNFMESSVASPYNLPAPLTADVSNTQFFYPSTATGALTSSANFGALSASGSGSTNIIPGSGAGVTVGSDVGAAPIVAYYDSLTVTSASLAIGTPVTLLFTESLASITASSNSGDQGAFAAVDGYYRITDTNPSSSGIIADSFSGTPLTGNGLLGSTTTPGVDDVVSVTFQTEVGDTIGLYGALYAGGQANSGNGHADTSFSFSANYNTCVDAQTQGAAFLTQSGAQYCSAFATVPEPSTLSLFGAALVTFAGFAVYRRRKQSPSDLAA